MLRKLLFVFIYVENTRGDYIVLASLMSILRACLFCSMRHDELLLLLLFKF